MSTSGLRQANDVDEEEKNVFQVRIHKAKLLVTIDKTNTYFFQSQLKKMFSNLH